MYLPFLQKMASTSLLDKETCCDNESLLHKRTAGTATLSEDILTHLHNGANNILQQHQQQQTNGKMFSKSGAAASNSSHCTSTNATKSNAAATTTFTSGTFMKLKTYLLALRPWSLSGSLVPTLLGSALAFRSQWSADFSIITFFLTIFTVVTVHCAGNVVNTYFDFVKGIDKQKADDRTLVDHILTKDEVG